LSDPEVAGLVTHFTEHLRCPSGGQVLWPLQALSLFSFQAQGGLYSRVRVGGGKTLISRCLPLIGKCQNEPTAEVPVRVPFSKPFLLVPAALYDKTLRDFEEQDAHWYAHPNLRVLTYEWLRHPRRLDFLLEEQPDLIVLDEAQALANVASVLVMRIALWKDLTGGAFAALSATSLPRSLIDAWHLLLYAFGHEATPLPANRAEAETWAAAVDPPPLLPPMFWRPPPARALLQLGGGLEPRDCVRLRIEETPGVVVHEGSPVDVPLTVSLVDTPLSRACRDALDQFRAGELLSCTERGDVVSAPQTAAQIRDGFYYYPEVPPPLSYLAARVRWRATVEVMCAEGLAQSEGTAKRKLDLEPTAHPPFQLTLAAWRAERASYGRPRVLVRWIDPSHLYGPVEAALARGALVWTRWRALGPHLAERFSVPYFGDGGLAGTTYIGDYRGPAVASIPSSGTGRHLVAWHEALVVDFPSGAGATEQLLGRHHRPGQNRATEYVFLNRGGLEGPRFARVVETAAILGQLGQPHKFLDPGTNLIYKQL
jgi:hypothetical protein